MYAIDKLELRLPRSVYFPPKIQRFIRHFCYASAAGSILVRRSRFYSGIVDLREHFGIDAFLHAYSKFGNKGDHKLEILDSGKKTYSDLVEIVEKVAEINPDPLAVMRIDLCADVYGVPLSWFQQHARIKYKRFFREIGEFKYKHIGVRGIQTLTAGKRPNLLRFYDKVEECKTDFKRRGRKISKDAEPLDFEKEYGFSPEITLTRIERQFGGGKLPKEINSFGKLQRAPEFNPFTPIQIIRGGDGRLPTVEECGGVKEWLCGTKLRELAIDWGMHQLRAWLNKNSAGNAARILERFSRFLPHDGENAVTSEQIYQIYRESVIQQLAA